MIVKQQAEIFKESSVFRRKSSTQNSDILKELSDDRDII